MVNQANQTPNRLISNLEPLLREADIAEPRRELIQLLSCLLQEPVARLLARLDDPLTQQQAEAFVQLVQRRASREPLAYITGTVNFSGLELAVGSGVLVPRPDSEILVEKAVELAQKMQARPLRLLDTCTGSGAIGIAIACQLRDSGMPVTLHLLDQSAEALAYVRRNSARWCSDLPVQIEQGDLFPAESLIFDLITANPPYIPDLVLPGLMPEVSRYEPVLALAGGADGLNFYRRILQRAGDYLAPGGWLLLEHGYDQAEGVSSMIKAESKFREPLQLKDYGGNPRAAAAQLLSTTDVYQPC